MDEVSLTPSAYASANIPGSNVSEHYMAAGRNVIVVEPQMTLFERIKKTVFQWVEIVRRFILDYCCCCCFDQNATARHNLNTGVPEGLMVGSQQVVRPLARPTMNRALCSSEDLSIACQ